MAAGAGTRLIPFEFLQVFGEKSINKIADGLDHDAFFGFFALGRNFHP
jgi:hypothetical protein